MSRSILPHFFNFFAQTHLHPDSSLRRSGRRPDTAGGVFTAQTVRRKNRLVTPRHRPTPAIQPHDSLAARSGPRWGRASARFLAVMRSAASDRRGRDRCGSSEGSRRSMEAFSSFVKGGKFQSVAVLTSSASWVSLQKHMPKPLQTALGSLKTIGF